jgi:hypothetical protein
MKSAVNAVSTIIEDVRLFKRRLQRERSDVDLDVLRSLRKKEDAKHSDLVAASKTHATSSRMWHGGWIIKGSAVHVRRDIMVHQIIQIVSPLW